MSVREYGFSMVVIFVPWMIGTSAFVSNALWGSLAAASFCMIVVSLFVIAVQIVADRFVDETHNRHSSFYTGEHLVNFSILTAVFTAVVSGVVAVWMSSTFFMTVWVTVLALFAIPGINAWIGQRRMKTTRHPIHQNFRVAVWTIPLATGAFLLLNFYGFARSGHLLYAMALVLYMGRMCLDIFHGTKDPVLGASHSVPRRAEHLIRSEAGQ